MKNLNKITEHCDLTISQRIDYGNHFEFPPAKRFCIIYWSNKKGGYWYLSGRTKDYQRVISHEQHPIIKLGCEEILLPYPRTVIGKIINNLCPHPLYKNSFESRRR
jgi:hypothetical protein